MNAFGSQAMSSSLARVLMRRPGRSLIAANAAEWHYGPTFNGERAVAQYAKFASLVEKSGAVIMWMEDPGDGLADSMFTHDPSLMTDQGAIILRMGKPLRVAEAALHEQAYKAAGIPILGRIEHRVRVPTLIATRGDEDGKPVYTFDIRLQGENETVFFDI